MFNVGALRAHCEAHAQMPRTNHRIWRNVTFVKINDPNYTGKYTNQCKIARRVPDCPRGFVLWTCGFLGVDMPTTTPLIPSSWEYGYISKTAPRCQGWPRTNTKRRCLFVVCEESAAGGDLCKLGFASPPFIVLLTRVPSCADGERAVCAHGRG